MVKCPFIKNLCKQIDNYITNGAYHIFQILFQRQTGRYHNVNAQNISKMLDIRENGNQGNVYQFRNKKKQFFHYKLQKYEQNNLDMK